MRKLFLLALVVGVYTPAAMAQETAGAGIYGGLQNPRFNAPRAIKQDVKQGTAKNAIYGDLQNPRFNVSETGNRYGASFPSNSRADAGVAAGRTQCPPRCPRDGHTNVEIYAGYSFLLLDGFETDDVDINDVLDQRLHFHGVDLSGTFNFSRYVGAQFDFSFHRRNQDLSDFDLLGDAEASIQSYLFGIQVKNNSKDGTWFRPFGHFLAGASRQRLEFNSPLLIPIIGDDEFSFRKTSFALAMGGGVDFRVTDVFSIRAIKLDYLPVFIDDFDAVGVSFNGRTQRNFRAGAGLVFHF
jgi:opacity protein-like surface antigen